MNETEFVVAVFGLLMAGGVAVLWIATQSRRQVREMEHRERLAMIERGVVPSPELDPAGFERHLSRAAAPESANAMRWRTGGILMIGLGLALTFLLAFAANEVNVAVGIGGAFVMVGGAFYVNSVMHQRGSTPPLPPYPSRRSEPRDPLPPA